MSSNKPVFRYGKKQSIYVTAVLMLFYTLLIFARLVSAESPEKAIPSLKRSDVVFMSRATPELYEVYGATFLAWGGHPRSIAAIDTFKQEVQAEHKLGMRYAAGIGWLTNVAEFIDFTPDFLNAVAIGLQGQNLKVPWLWDHSHKGHPFYLFLDIHPLFKAFLERNTRWAMKANPDAFHMDDLTGSCAIGAGSSSQGGCFNEAYIIGFRDFLTKYVPADSLEKYGIHDINNFNYAEFLRGRSDRPLWDYYSLYTLKSSMSVVSWLKEVMHDELGRDIPLSGNAAYSNVRHLPYCTILDYLSCEVNEYADQGLTGGPLLDYKIAEALGKPIAATAHGGDWAFVKVHNSVNLVRGWIAEAYAFGQNFMSPHRQWCYTKELGSHYYLSQTEDYAPLYRFIGRNAELFDNYEPIYDTGLFFSFSNYRRDQASFNKLLFSLTSRNIPSGIVIAGDDWLDIRISEKILDKFHTIIIPENLILDPEQKKILDTWSLSNRLIIWKNEEDFFSRYTIPFQVQGAENIWIVPRINPDNKKAPVILHVLNRNYDQSSDSCTPCNRLAIKINKAVFPRRTFTEVQLHTYDRATIPLKFQNDDDFMTVHIPELDQWGIISLK